MRTILHRTTVATALSIAAASAFAEDRLHAATPVREPQAASVQQPVRPAEPFIAEIMMTPPPGPGASHDLQAADDGAVDAEIMVPGVYLSEQAPFIVVPPSPVVP